MVDSQAFSLDFNLRAHMRTHSQENYHVCPYEDCQKRFAHSYKLQGHIKSHHEKVPPFCPFFSLRHRSDFWAAPPQAAGTSMAKSAPPEERAAAAPKPAAALFSDRPYACPYEGCGKSYIHEYKLKLHLRREHPGHGQDNGKLDAEGKSSAGKASKRSRSSSLSAKLQQQQQQQATPPPPPPSKISRKAPALTPASSSKKPWPPATAKGAYEDSEETEEDCENPEEDAWRYQGTTNADDEETEDED